MKAACAHVLILLTLTACGVAAPSHVTEADHNTTIDKERIYELFEVHFTSHYEARQCGLNIGNFIKALDQRGIDLTGFKLVQIVNKGFSVFGMVNAEKARSQRFDQPAAVEMNWYHHVILVDKRGTVYDFDYLTTPSPRPLVQYVETMFLAEDECKEGRYISGEFCAGRETKLQDYVWTVLPAKDYVLGVEDNQVDLTMAEALQSL